MTLYRADLDAGTIQVVVQEGAIEGLRRAIAAAVGVGDYGTVIVLSKALEQLLKP